jgi:hypothetical protein
MTSKLELNRVFLERMTGPMVRMDLPDIPRKMDRDQKLLRALRTPESQLEAAVA